MSLALMTTMTTWQLSWKLPVQTFTCSVRPSQCATHAQVIALCVKFPTSSYHLQCGWIWVSGTCSPCLAPLEGKTCPPPCWRRWPWFPPADRHISIRRHLVRRIKQKTVKCDVCWHAPHRYPLLTLSSTISKEKSLPSPLELLQVRIADLVVTRALMVHLSANKEQTLV